MQNRQAVASKTLKSYCPEGEICEIQGCIWNEGGSAVCYVELSEKARESSEKFFDLCSLDLLKIDVRVGFREVRLDDPSHSPQSKESQFIYRFMKSFFQGLGEGFGKGIGQAIFSG